MVAAHGGRGDDGTGAMTRGEVLRLQVTVDFHAIPFARVTAI